MKLKLREKIGYALGDTAANIAWRSLTTFLLIFYTDSFGLTPADAGILLLVARLTDGVADLIMGMIADRTKTKWGKFRPWILWSAVPLGVLMILTFTTPDWSYQGKLIYAYITYILLMYAYTANNIPYAALMGVMTPDHKERTSLSSFRFAGAYLGGIIAQGLLIYLVAFLGKGNTILGYQYSMYLMAALLVGFLLITFFSTKERVVPQKEVKPSIKKDLKDLAYNKAWLILLLIGFVFVTFNSIKQGITVIYFKHYIGSETLAASYMVILLVISMVAALATSPLSNFFGKKNLFIYAMLFSGIFTAMLYFANPTDTILIFTLGTISEFGAGILPVLFFAMLGDAADYSEFKNNRRATGLVYSAGTFAMKFGGGVAGAIIGFVLSAYRYDGMNHASIEGSVEGIKLLMSWIPAVLIVSTSAIMLFYPLNKNKMEIIQNELTHRRDNNI